MTEEELQAIEAWPRAADAVMLCREVRRLQRELEEIRFCLRLETTDRKSAHEQAWMRIEESRALRRQVEFMKRMHMQLKPFEARQEVRRLQRENEALRQMALAGGGEPR